MVQKKEGVLPVTSMTGFARAEGEMNGLSWACEIKSVNSKGLDVRCRFPHGYDRLEGRARDRVAVHLTRGSISVNLTLSRRQLGDSYRINQDVLEQILIIAPDIQHRLPGSPPLSTDALLAVRGVIELVEHEETEEEKRDLGDSFLGSVGEAIEALSGMRADEGRRLAEVLDAQIEQIEILCNRATEVASTQPTALKDRLISQLSEIVSQVPALSDERLAQEVALIVAKADIREELDRLRSHIEAARDLMENGGAVGRRLDFLCQEFLRETNTLCSKSSDIELTRLGIELKAVIEQLREQVQNVE
jgi:uncharacterized protein (TIGR00255 family)